MDRDEVLERLDEAAAIGDGWSCVVGSTVLRAAAALIRQSKVIAEALDEIVSCEPIDADPIHKRIKYVAVQIDRIDLERYQKLLAHFLSEPEPPAREVEP